MAVTHAVDHDTDSRNLSFDVLQSVPCHTKIVNMCTMYDYDRVITCSREPIIKMHDLSGAGQECQFSGHEMSVSTVDVERTDGKLMASGGRDCTTIVWDIETQKIVKKRLIARNVITQIKWIPGQPNLFVETSEDLYTRIFDIRVKPFKPTVEVKVDTNFSLSCDIMAVDGDQTYLATGHRGFNGEGTVVKLWDLRKLMSADKNSTYTSEQLAVSVNTSHKFTPEAVKFLRGSSSDKVRVVSAAMDSKI